MAIERSDAVRHLDDLISRLQNAAYYDPEDEERPIEADRHEVVFGLRAALRRLAPPGSEYARALDEADQLEMGYESQKMQILAGAAIALRHDYDNDRLQTFGELFNAEFCDDFLSMSEYFIEHDGKKDPAAVLAGGVLEQHIRRLCEKYGVDPTTTRNGKDRPKSVDTMNQDLREKGVYTKIDWQHVTAWYGIRNHAAHAKYDDYDANQVRNMIEGIRGFISRYPA